MISRIRLALVLGALAALSGCSDSFNAGPIVYSKSPKLDTDLKDKPRLKAAVEKALAQTFGPNPREIRVPKGLKLPGGGIFLADHFVPAEQPKAAPKPIAYRRGSDPKAPLVLAEGGYSLYRRHCLHCHGVSGDGNGPTADFLWPRPRDYRPGIFKFTSTTTQKPTRDDLRKTLYHGIPNSSMPAFDGLMTRDEIEQVIDYVVFLSARGQSEISLINSASQAEESEADTYFTEDIVAESTDIVFQSWADAETSVLNPPVPRTPSSPESIARGRALFLGKPPEKLECAGCHGPQAVGDGPSWIDPETFNKYVFGLESSDQKRFEGLKQVAEERQKKWNDEWGMPLRPANLNLGVYKGGRRPIDIYWRVAKGINGTPMPAHATILKPEQIWDVVNFVLALPYDRELLKDAKAAPVSPAPAVARR